jgi:hypothetical protein
MRQTDNKILSTLLRELPWSSHIYILSECLNGELTALSREMLEVMSNETVSLI